MKTRHAAMALTVAALLSWQILPVDNVASRGIISPCSTNATGAGGCYMICPQGDGTRFDQIGAVIRVVVKDPTGRPVSGILAADFWLEGCTGQLTLCGGAGAIDADSANNAEGRTTISGSLASGGCDIGLLVIVQGTVVRDPQDCTRYLCLPYDVKSPDISGDLIVDIIDLSLFANGYTSPPKPYQWCYDFNCDALVDIIDFSIFAQHYLHAC